jgi:FkbM family methyltransferase
MPSLHAEALDLFAAGKTSEAIDLLRRELRQSLDLDAVNDLAVMLAGAGERAAARELLVALRHVDPEHGGAEENLAQLGGDFSGGGSMADARARFLQVIAEAQQVWLPDNTDTLFHPAGHPLPDPAQAGERIALQLAVLERCGALWRGLGDDNSRELLLRYLAYRALGPAHVRLELEPTSYRQSVVGLVMQCQAQANVLGSRGMPLEWQMAVYDLSSVGYPLQVIGHPLPLASTFLFSQYAYRDEATLARPRPGDVALDVGGCWGDTALWLAHVVGPEGHVHTFEPTPANRSLLAKNVSLNPAIAARIRIWDAPLAGTAGETVFIRDGLAAGATMRTDADAVEGDRCELHTDTIDEMLRRGDLPRVDFLKVDVEGADLGVLEGAAETIASCRPRLALAAYHKPDDLETLPGFVESLGVPYRWYMQCSTMTDVDTVLFGVPVE